MATDMAEVSNGLLTEEQQKEIEALAKEENRPASEIIDVALKLYKLRRLSEYGKAQAIAQGLKPRNQAHADRIVNKAIREVREEDKARGK